MNVFMIGAGISAWYRRAGLLAWRGWGTALACRALLACRAALACRALACPAALAWRAAPAWRTVLAWRNALLRTRGVSGPRIRTADTVCVDGAALADGLGASGRSVGAVVAVGVDADGAGVADGA